MAELGTLINDETVEQEDENSGGQETKVDCEGNLLHRLTDVTRTTTIDNFGCKFKIVEHNYKMEVATTCNGKACNGVWVDLIGDSTKQNVADYLSTEKRKKHNVRTKYFVYEGDPSTLSPVPTSLVSSPSIRVPTSIETFQSTMTTTPQSMPTTLDSPQSTPTTFGSAQSTTDQFEFGSPTTTKTLQSTRSTIRSTPTENRTQSIVQVPIAAVNESKAAVVVNVNESKDEGADVGSVARFGFMRNLKKEQIGTTQ